MNNFLSAATALNIKIITQQLFFSGTAVTSQVAAIKASKVSHRIICSALCRFSFVNLSLTFGSKIGSCDRRARSEHRYGQHFA